MFNKQNKSDHYFNENPQSEVRLGLIKTYIKGKFFKFLTSSGVFSKRQIDSGTRLLTESSIIPDKGYVLDLGCGYGVIGITIAFFNPNLKVFMIDLNKRAIWLSRRNVKINNVKNVEIRIGQFYEPVKTLKFNSILSNPPISAGMTVVKNMIVEAPRYMDDKATFQMVIKSKIGKKLLPQLFEDTFGNVKILTIKSGYRVLIAEKN